MKRVITLPRPLPHQLEFLRSPARRKILVNGRKWGKTKVCIIPVIDGHGPRGELRGCAHGKKGLWVAPTYNIASDIWYALKHALAGVWLEKHEDARTILMPGGGSITVRSADNPDSLRGPNYDFLVIDEAAMIRDDTWEYVLGPTLAAPPSGEPGWAIFISTPKGVDNWFYKAFVDAGKFDNWARWQRPTSDNPVVSREFLEGEKAKISSYAWRQEYLAEFISKEGGLFKREDARFYRVEGSTFFFPSDSGRVLDLPFSSFKVFVTCDTATSTKTSADHTAIAAWAVSPRGHLALIDLYLRRVEGGEIMRQIVAMCRRWDCTAYVEENATSKHLLSIMEEAGIPFRTVLPGSSDKWTRAQDAVALWERHLVMLPERAEWRDAFERQLYNFEPKGKDDDSVDAFAYAARVMRDELSPSAGEGLPMFVAAPDPRARDLPSGVALARPGSRRNDD